MNLIHHLTPSWSAWSNQPHPKRGSSVLKSSGSMRPLHWILPSLACGPTTSIHPCHTGSASSPPRTKLSDRTCIRSLEFISSCNNNNNNNNKQLSRFQQRWNVVLSREIQGRKIPTMPEPGTSCFSGPLRHSRSKLPSSGNIYKSAGIWSLLLANLERHDPPWALPSAMTVGITQHFFFLNFSYKKKKVNVKSSIWTIDILPDRFQVRGSTSFSRPVTGSSHRADVSYSSNLRARSPGCMYLYVTETVNYFFRKRWTTCSSLQNMFRAIEVYAIVATWMAQIPGLYMTNMSSSLYCFCHGPCYRYYTTVLSSIGWWKLFGGVGFLLAA